ncbi:MAG: peptidoglycan DD-metalloendopeptidase family protein [Methylacidiphilales bacterium]|nr:peptidoglycan DD-metalloendopeptidase family protein [Candidatus Methylacidiphilales bacterium]NJR16661.1 peptidoglycan DD-metalloendopeptidase family protein [Calothrix sp. CSU_2_0]
MRTVYLKKKQFFLGFAFVVSCIICIFVASEPVRSLPREIKSAPVETLKQQQQQLQQQHQQVVKERTKLTNLQNVAEDRLNNLQQNLQTTNSQIQDSENRLQLATQSLQQLQAELATAEKSFLDRQNATTARLRFLQRSPNHQGWAILLQSGSISDFLSRRKHLKMVYQADQNILGKLTEAANQITQQKTNVEQAKNEISLIRQQLLAQKSDYQAQSTSQSELIQRLNSDRLALAAAENQLERDSQAIGNLIQQKIAEAKARETAAKALGKRFLEGTGIFGFPSDAPISSPFGWRMHPVLGYRRLHTGIDFAGAYGSVIRAADSGTVIFAGWYGGYGNAVIISHGKNITTLYGHSSQLYVSEGQSVQRGQPIAAVGSTGLSTGPHLHFEVRRDGTPIDPAGFL